jgi:hypothetical protein
MTRIELVTSSLPRKRSTPELHRQPYQRKKSGRRGSNPRLSAWKADALPTELLPQQGNKVWGQMDSNHRRRSQQIYSLPHLATLVYPQQIFIKKRADSRTRTNDQLITNQLLYQLSYIGFSYKNPYYLVLITRLLSCSLNSVRKDKVFIFYHKHFFDFFLLSAHFFFLPH